MYIVCNRVNSLKIFIGVMFVLYFAVKNENEYMNRKRY